METEKEANVQPELQSDDKHLSIGDAMDVLRAKWNVETLTAVLCGQTRFKDIMSSVKGISEKVLADRLRQLAEDRLIEKQECYGNCRCFRIRL